MHIRKDDMVVVITGDEAEKGRVRKVLRVTSDKKKLVVEGVNRVYKHLKPSRQNNQGGRLSKEMPIDISNVMLYCNACRHGVRVGHRYSATGQKERYCKKCKTTLCTVGRPRKAYAQK